MQAGRVFTSMLVTACCTSAGAGPVAPGEPFSLRTGESAHVGSGTLRVGFDGVTADSRCAKGERCIVAGDATVRVWLQRGAGARETHQLQLAPAGGGRVASGLQLLRLDPAPVSGVSIGPRDYRATLVLTRGTAADPER